MHTAEVDYGKLESLATKMKQLGDSVFQALDSAGANFEGAVYTLLQQRNDYYSQIEALWSSGNFDWAHLTGDSDPNQASLQAYEAFDAVLSQNQELQNRIHQLVGTMHDRLIQVDQQKRIEKAYHPQPAMVGGFVAEAR